MPNALDGARVVSLESRRAKAMARLLEKQGAIPIVAPSMREVPHTEQADAQNFGEELLARKCDVLVLLTGVGATMLFDVVRHQHGEKRLLQCLRETPVYCRGPKPRAVVEKMGLTPAGVAPEPNTWRELVGLFGGGETVRGKRVFVQEYGKESPELCAALMNLGATVQSVLVYAWRLPEDTEPLERAAKTLANSEADAVLFTSAQQLVHLMDVADRSNLRDPLLRALKEDVVVASVGPVTSAALAELGVRVDTTPPHPKMGHLVSHLASEWQELRKKWESHRVSPTR